MAKTVAAGGGLFTVGSTWVGGVAPLASDDAICDGTSGNLTIDTGAVCRSLDFNGYSGLCVHNANATLTIGDGTPGAGNRALRMSPTMTYLKMHPQTSAISFVSTSATQQTITWESVAGNHVFGNISYGGASGGSWIWSDNHICSFAGLNATHTHVRGTLNTNDKTFIGGQITGSNSNARTLTMGASIFYLYGVGNNCWLFATVTSLTVTANTAKIYLMRSLTNFAPLIQSGTVTWGIDVEWIGGGICTIASGGVPSFKNVTVNGGIDLGDGREDRLQQNNSWTSTGIVTFNGFSSTRRLRVHSNGGARTVTVPNGTSVTGQYVDFQNTSLSVSNNLSAIVGGAGDLGGNTNIVFTSGITKYFHTSTSGVKQYNDSQFWFTATNGSGATSAPLPQDDVRFDVNSFPVTGITVRNGVGCFQLGRHIDWTGAINSPTWDFQVDVINNGSLTLAPGMTVTSYASAFFTMFGSGASQFFTVDFAGVQMPHTLFLINFAGTNTCTLQSDFIGNALNTTLFQTTGLIITNNKNITTGRVSQSSGTLTLGSSIITLKGTGTIWNSAGTLSAGTSEIIVDSQNITAKVFTGGTKTYNKITLQGNFNDTLQFSGNNSIANFSNTKTSAHTLQFALGSVTTFTGTVTKTTGALWVLTSTTSGNFTWSKASGSVVFVDAIISKSTASGGATFTANTNSIDGGSNTGWTGFVSNPFLWTNGAANGLGSDPANWFGGVVPSTSDVALFTGAFNGNCSGLSQDVLGIFLSNGYTGTVSSNVNIGSTGIDVFGGTLTLGTSGVQGGGVRHILGTLTLPAGEMIVTPQGSVKETWRTSGGTLNHSNGKVSLSGASEAIINNVNGRSFFDFNFGGVPVVSGNFFVDGSTSNPCTTLNADVSVKLNCDASNYSAGTGIFRLIGTTSVVCSLLVVPNLQLNCTNTITFGNNLTINGSTTITACTTLNGFSLKCKGNITTADTAISGTTNMSIEGTTYEQAISGAGVLIGDVTINKDEGRVKLLSHMTIVDIGKNFTLTKGQFNTNEFNVVFNNNLIINEATGGLYFETPTSNTQVNGTLTGRKIARRKLYENGIGL